MAATVVLVHGAFGGSWVWQKVIEQLEARGLDAVAVDLPTCNCEAPTVDASDDAQHVRSVVEGIDGPVVLVGNSYGGVVISGVTGAGNVKRLVYLAAGMPQAGEPFFAGLSSAATDEFNSGLGFSEEGMVSLDPEVGVRAAFHNAGEADHETWRAKRVPMSFGIDQEKGFSEVAWSTVPSTYVVCGDDRALKPEVLRGWAKERATEVVEWPTDHCPQVSDPVRVVDFLEALATAS